MEMDIEKGVETILNQQFSFAILKKRFTYLVYKWLKYHNYPFKLFIYEDSNHWKDMVVISFYDEHGYFRKLEVPLPILKRDAEKAESGKADDDPLISIAKELLEDSEKNAIRIPRSYWSRIPHKDIHDLMSKK